MLGVEDEEHNISESASVSVSKFHNFTRRRKWILLSKRFAFLLKSDDRKMSNYVS
jgi:hypothetical protein